MFICICRAVTDDQIDTAILLGAETVEAVAVQTRASTGCGGCRGKIQGMIDGRIDGRCPVAAAARPAGSAAGEPVSVRVAGCAVTSRYLTS